VQLDRGGLLNGEEDGAESTPVAVRILARTNTICRPRLRDDVLMTTLMRSISLSRLPSAAAMA